MTALSWANGISGNWNDATKWNFGVVPSASDDVTIGNSGVYVVAVTTADVANSLTFNAANATLAETTTGSLNLAGALTLDAGTVLLRHANTIGSATVNGGLLESFVGGALGTASLSLHGGEFTAMASQFVNNQLNIGAGGTIIDAATGTTLRLVNGNWGLDATASPTVQFGSATRKGVVEWHTGFAVITNVGAYVLDVAGGTLRAGDSEFGFLTGNDQATTVTAGGKIDLNGFSTVIHQLAGAGAIVNGGAAAALTLQGGNFAGVISGNISVDITTSADLAGVNTFTGSTTIESGQFLFTYNKGSVAGAIVDNGQLIDDDNAGDFVTGVISGTGTLTQEGAGTLVLGHANSFSGGAFVSAGKTVLGNGKGLGTGLVTIDNGALIGSITETMSNSLVIRDNSTISAATGATLTMTGGSDITWDAASSPLNLTFGDAADKGTVVLSRAGSLTAHFAQPIHVKVADGTLRGSHGALAFFLTYVTDVTVEAGATLDLGGSNTFTPTLTSPGAITNSSVSLATLITENTSTVSGVISGKLKVEVLNGTLNLSGANTYVGGTKIDSGASLTLSGAGSVNGVIDDEGALTINKAAATSIAGVISGAGTLTQSGAGVTTLSGINTFSGGTVIQKGVLAITNGKALGSGGVTVDNAELLATSTMTLANSPTFLDKATIAAAAGTTLTMTGTPFWIAGTTPLTLIFGDSAHQGVVVEKFSGAFYNHANPIHLKVAYGTVRAGSTIFGILAGAAASDVTVSAGATLDLGGFAFTAPVLTSAGSITSTGIPIATLSTDGASSASGVISGKVKVDVATGVLTLSGIDTYTGGTVVETGATLVMSGAGAISGNIADAGTVTINESGAVSLAGAISGAGVVDQRGSGITTLSGHSTYAGGTDIEHGELISTNSAALGTGGTITMTGGELLAGASQVLTHDLSTAGLTTLAVTTGDTLVLNTANLNFHVGTTYIGDATHAGTVLWNVSSSISTTVGAHIEVRDGTLKLGSGLANNLFALLATGRIDAGATLDLNGVSAAINSLTGGGTLTTSHPVTALDLEGTTNFGGVISGAIAEIDIFGTATLTGNETFTGKAVIEGGATLSPTGLFGEDVQFAGAGTLVLAIPPRFTGTIQDFQSGSTVDLKNITTGAGATLAYNTTTGVLTVKDGVHTDTVKFGAGLVLGNFVAAADGAGGTDINWQMAPAFAMPATPAKTSARAHTPPAPLVEAMASFQAPYTAATMLIPPPAPFQGALASVH